MKRKNLLHSGIVLFLIQALFSCSSAEYYRFAPTQQKAFGSIKEKPIPVSQPAEVVTAGKTFAAAPAVLPVTKTEPVLAADAHDVKPVLFEKNKAVGKVAAPVKIIPQPQTELTTQETEALSMVQARLAQLNKAQKKELKAGIKEVLKESASGTNIIEIILAVLLPPLAVFLHEGINNRFWISLLLTILFFIPGVIYALLVVTDSI
jgi:uncharacterized membrane protein YqaE (UPF0057 family)